MGKKWPKCLFQPINFLALGLPWIGEFDGFKIMFIRFPTQQNPVPVYRNCRKGYDTDLAYMFALSNLQDAALAVRSISCRQNIESRTSTRTVSAVSSLDRDMCDVSETFGGGCTCTARREGCIDPGPALIQNDLKMLLTLNTNPSPI